MKAVKTVCLFHELTAKACDRADQCVLLSMLFYNTICWRACIVYAAGLEYMYQLTLLVLTSWLSLSINARSYYRIFCTVLLRCFNTITFVVHPQRETHWTVRHDLLLICWIDETSGLGHILVGIRSHLFPTYPLEAVGKRWQNPCLFEATDIYRDVQTSLRTSGNHW